MTMTRGSAITVLGGLPAAIATLTAPARAATPLRVAYIPFENSAQVFYAKELGYFANADLDVQLQPIPFGSAIAAGVASNAVDIGYATTVTIATAHSRGLPFVFIAPANEFILRSMKDQTSGIVVGAGSAIRSARDLNGKTFATAGLASLAEFGPRAWVDANGGDSATIKFIELPFSAMPDALAAGRVDAAFIVDPYFAKAKETGRLLAIGLDAVAKDFIVAGWIATSAWAKAHPTEVAGFARAIQRATVWSNANPARAADILAQYLKVEPSLIASTQRAVFAERFVPALLQPGIDNAARYGKFASFRAEELVYAP